MSKSPRRFTADVVIPDMTADFAYVEEETLLDTVASVPINVEAR